MRVVVVGLGIFGSTLARVLSRSGAEVIAIDSDPERVEALRDDVELAVRADASDRKVMSEVGAAKADVLVACIGETFEGNEIATLVANQLGVPRVLARATTEARGEVLRRVGAHEVINPEEEAAIRLAQRILMPGVHEYFRFAARFAVAEATVPKSFVGKTLMELGLRSKHRVNLVCLRRPPIEEGGEERIDVAPDPEKPLLEGDILMLAGRQEDLNKLLKR